MRPLNAVYLAIALAVLTTPPALLVLSGPAFDPAAPDCSDVAPDKLARFKLECLDNTIGGARWCAGEAERTLCRAVPGFRRERNGPSYPCRLAASADELRICGQKDR